jgi:hypothetical protein
VCRYEKRMFAAAPFFPSHQSNLNQAAALKPCSRTKRHDRKDDQNYSSPRTAARERLASSHQSEKTALSPMNRLKSRCCGSSGCLLWW